MFPNLSKTVPVPGPIIEHDCRGVTTGDGGGDAGDIILCNIFELKHRANKRSVERFYLKWSTSPPTSVACRDVLMQNSVYVKPLVKPINDEI